MTAVHRLFIILLLVLCVLLYGALMLSGNIDDSSSGVDNAMETAINTIDTPQLKSVLSSMDQYSDLVERPLFVEGRRPVIEAESDEQTEDTGQLDDWTLVGIFTNTGETYALFTQQEGAGKKSLKKTVGEDVAGWDITDIQLQQVVLKKGLQSKTVLLRKPKPKQEPIQPAKKTTPNRPIVNPFIKKPANEK